MKIFLSWSGELSRSVATELRTWLRMVMHVTDPWMSGKDIPAGKIWFERISESLRQSRYGIICVTRENQKKPWLLWEAGALFRGFEQAQEEAGGGSGGGTSHVVPILIDLKKEDLVQPLSFFQVIDVRDKADVLHLLTGINNEQSNPLPLPILEQSFERCWPDFQNVVAQAIKEHPFRPHAESSCPYTFAQAAEKFLKIPGKQEGTIRRERISLDYSLPYIGDLPLDKVNDDSLMQYKEDRLAGTVLVASGTARPKPAAATTLNKDLRVFGTVLRKASNEWKWIAHAPVIKKVAVQRTKRPYVLSWDEQTRIFQRLPPHVMRAALFMVNTGVRKGAIGDLEWRWLKTVSGIERPVIVIPPGYHGARYGKTILINSIAGRVLDIQRQLDSDAKYVFMGRKGRRFSFQKEWRTAWRRSGLPEDGYSIGVDNLRRTFEQRLYDASVTKEHRDFLLGVADAVATAVKHRPDYKRLMDCVEKITDRQDRTLINI